MPEYVTLKEISERIGIDRSRARRWIIGKGFSFVQIRDDESRQLVNALTVEDAERIIEIRGQQGFTVDGEKDNPAVIDNSAGFFYVACLMPDIAPNRIKIGFANSIPSRMDAHRTTCPRLQLIKYWPCRRTFEPAVIAVAITAGSALYGGEVYDVESIDDVVRRIDAFFAMVE